MLQGDPTILYLHQQFIIILVATYTDQHLILLFKILAISWIRSGILWWVMMDFPHSSLGKSSACNAGDPGLIPVLGRSPGEANSNPLQCSCLEKPMDRGAWRLQSMGLQRVGHDRATKPPPPSCDFNLYFSDV